MFGTPTDRGSPARAPRWSWPTRAWALVATIGEVWTIGRDRGERIEARQGDDDDGAVMPLDARRRVRSRRRSAGAVAQQTHHQWRGARTRAAGRGRRPRSHGGAGTGPKAMLGPKRLKAWHV